MAGTLLGKAMYAARTVAAATAVMSGALLLVWCVAVVAHLCLLRFPLTRTGLDVCCVDD